MGELGSELVILKLGGSLITYKDKPMSANLGAIATAAAAIGKSVKSGLMQRLIIIHGGGSFGHYYASQFGLSRTRRAAASLGTAKTAGAMVSLHSILLEKLLENEIACKTVLTSETLSPDGERLTESGKRSLDVLLKSNYIPVSFGNVSITARGTSIISGDQIALALARKLRANRVVFAMDVDGIYPDSSMKGEILTELISPIVSGGKKRTYDVTGGIQAKIACGFRLAALGVDVFYVNGFYDDRLNALISLSDSARSTRIKAKGRKS